MISIVVAVQGQGAWERLAKSLPTWPHAEIVVVHWNPLCEVPPLPREVRVITVPESVHLNTPGNEQMPFFEYVAKNLGIRRSTGEWILCTNADILFSTGITVKLEHGKLESGVFYRANRINLGQDLKEIRFIGADEGAGGDFMLMHRSLWIECHGYPEHVGDDTIDSLMIDLAKSRGIKQIVFPDPVYHQFHEPGRKGWPSIASRWEELRGQMNQENSWGLGGAEYEEVIHGQQAKDQA